MISEVDIRDWTEGLHKLQEIVDNKDMEPETREQFDKWLSGMLRYFKSQQKQIPALFKEGYGLG